MLEGALAVKRAVPDVPVIAAGCLQTRDICEKALAERVTNAIGLGRVLLADPDWLRKVSGSMSGPVRACVQCDTCFRQVSQLKPVFCSRWTKEEKAGRLQGIPAERLAKKQPDEA